MEQKNISKKISDIISSSEAIKQSLNYISSTSVLNNVCSIILKDSLSEISEIKRSLLYLENDYSYKNILVLTLKLEGSFRDMINYYKSKKYLKYKSCISNCLAIFNKWKNVIDDLIKDDLVSIIIISYKNLNFFKEALNSVFFQTYSNIEIIFSDDGTPDFNENEIKNYIYENKKSNIKNVIINHNKINLGTVKNLNKAVKMCSGEYIFNFAVDDEIHDENVVEDTVNFFKENKCDICTGYMKMYDSTMTRCIGFSPNKQCADFIDASSPEELLNRLCFGNLIAAPSTKFRKSFFEKYGYFDEKYRLLEDYTKWIQISKKGCKIKFFNRFIMKYRSEVGISNKRNPLLDKDELLLYENEIVPYILEKVGSKKIAAFGNLSEYKKAEKAFKYKISYIFSFDKLEDNSLIEVKDLNGFLNEDMKNTFLLILNKSDNRIYNIISKLNLKYAEQFFICR